MLPACQLTAPSTLNSVQTSTNPGHAFPAHYPPLSDSFFASPTHNATLSPPQTPSVLSTPHAPTLPIPPRHYPERVITCYHTNARSILKKRHDLQATIASHSPPIDVLFITETHLDDSINNSELLPPSYTITRRDRNRNGGGVMIATTNFLKPIPRPDLIPETLEACACEIACEDGRHLFLCIYRPPSSPAAVDDNITDMLEQLNTITHRFTSITVCGDLNLPTANNTPHQKINLWCNILGASQLVDFPTRPQTSDTCDGNILDVTITNRPELTSNITCLPPLGKSDHIAYSFSLSSPPKPKTSWSRTFLYSKTDVQGLQSAIENIPWELVTDPLNPASSWDNCLAIIEALRHDFVPYKKSKRSTNPIWITSDVRRSMKRRDRLYRAALHSKNSGSKNAHRTWAKYKQSRNQTNRLLSSAHNNYLASIAAKNQHDSRSLWSHFRSLKSTSYPNSLYTDNPDLATDDPSKIAETFNNQFVSAFNHPGNRTFSTSRPKSPRSLSSVTTTPTEVWSIIKKLPNNKAAGPDGITPLFLKLCGPTFAKVLSTIFNASLSSGIVPPQWKTSAVIPLHKSGPINCFKNYRPISLYSIPAKILERIVLRHLQTHFDQSDTIPPEQHGFQPGKSCTSLLSEFIHDLSSFLDVPLPPVVDAVFIDWQKAFDSVDIHLLLQKLKHYGIQGDLLTWLSSFLLGRQQYVRFQNHSSTPQPVNSGVPQGSVLGPFLFILFIADLPDHIHHSLIKFFADDTCLYKQIQSRLDHIQLQDDLDALIAWCDSNGLTLNKSKCVTMHFTRKRSHESEPYFIANHALQPVTTTKYLGIILSSDLSWDHQVERAVSRASRASGFIRRNIRSSNGNLELYKLLFIAMCRSNLTYAIPSWSPHLVKHQEALESVQRTFTRSICYREQKSCPHYNERLKLFNLPPISNFCQFTSLSFVADRLYSYTSQTPNNFYSISPNSDNLRLQHIYARCNALKFSPFVSFPRTFNSLPPDIRNTLLFSSTDFKSHLHRFLLT